MYRINFLLNSLVFVDKKLGVEQLLGALLLLDFDVVVLDALGNLVDHFLGVRSLHAAEDADELGLVLMFALSHLSPR